MNVTENLKLKKPSGTDKVNISDINDNMDILDGKITALDSIYVGPSTDTPPEGKDIWIVTDGTPTEKVLYGTLAVGSTTLVFTDDIIKDTSLITMYSNPYGLSPETTEQSGNTLTFTFGAQDKEYLIAVRVLNA